MALDRQSIERKDFPVGRRGYDPQAVDAHLAAVAEEVSELQRSARRRSDTLATAASEQVRAIVEAAELSAQQITGDAETDAREIRSEATKEAQSVREEAAQQAREYVGKVSESTAAMLQRLDSMETELGTLVESLRAGATRLTSDLQSLETDLAGVSDSVLPGRPEFEPDNGGGVDAEGFAPPAEAAEFDQVAGDTGELGPAAQEGELGFADESVGGSADTAVLEPATAGASADGAVAEEDDDAEGARLIALNMALNGTPREETERYLSENFQLSNAGGLLDEVYASVEG